MDVERRAQLAYDKGESVRAVVMLAERLKSAPAEDQLLEPLHDYYLGGVENPGLERDVAEALVGVEGGEAVAASIARELQREGRQKMAEAFDRAAEEVDLDVSVGVPVVSGGERSERDARTGGRAEPSRPESPTKGTEPISRSSRSGGSEAPRTRDDSHDAASERGASSAPPSAAERGDAPSPNGETEESDRSDTSVEGTQEQRTSPDEGPPGDERDVEADRHASRRGVVLALAVAALLGGGYAVWQASSPGPEAALDRELATFDPTDSSDARASLRRAKQVVRRGEGVRERGEFIDALVALRSGTTASFDGEPETAWGRAARTAAALTRNDIESAVRYQRELERRRSDEALPRLWAGARVAEARGKMDRARTAFHEAFQAHPDFEPFAAGVVRTAAAAMDRAGFERAMDRLDERFPDHPYLADRSLTFPDGWRAGDVDVREPIDPSTPWNRSIRTYQRARRAAHRGRCSKTLELTDRMLTNSRGFGPAIWLEGICAAAEFEVSRADEAFGRLVEADGLAADYRWRLQVTAPTVLTAAGRPDMAAKYLLAGTEPVRIPESGPASADEGTGAKTVVPRTGHWSGELDESVVEPPWRVRAELARVETLAAVGAVGRAKRRLDAIGDANEADWRRALTEAELDVARGTVPAGRGEWSRRRASPVERMVTAFHEGRPAEAREQVNVIADPEDGDGRLLRYLVLADAASGRVRRAQSGLQDRSVAPVNLPDVGRLEGRILARLEGGSDEMPQGCRRLREVAPTSAEAAVDLGACLLWSGRVDEADAWAARGTRLHPDSPMTNWVRGIVLRALGRGDRAERYLARSWRSDRGGSRLDLELGVVNVALGKWERARDLFREALYKQPGNVRAIRRLGRTYLRIDADEGRWNFERLLEGYRQRDGRRLQAAEVHRWLAIFHGSREGEGGWDHLERARELIGRRRSILVEMARYREARGEWDEAEARYLDVLERDATSPKAHIGLARVADAIHEPRTMKTHLEQYLELRPRGERAAWAREQVKRLADEESDSDSED